MKRMQKFGILFVAVAAAATLSATQISAAEAPAAPASSSVDTNLDANAISTQAQGMSVDITQISVAGGVTYTFEVRDEQNGLFTVNSSDTNMVQVVDRQMTANGTQITVKGLKTGTAQLTLAQGEQRITIPVTVQSVPVKIDTKKVTVEAGSQYTFLASAPKGAEFTVSSSNPNVAKYVSQTEDAKGRGVLGVVEGVSAGTATITVAAGDQTATFEITVVPVPIRLDTTKASLATGAKYTFLIKQPKNGNFDITASNPNLVEIVGREADSKGRGTLVTIRATGEGVSTVTVKLGDQSESFQVTSTNVPIVVDTKKLQTNPGALYSFLISQPKHVDFKITSSDEKVIHIGEQVSDSRGTLVTVQGGDLGSATITITNYGTTQTIPVTVVESPIKLDTGNREMNLGDVYQFLIKEPATGTFQVMSTDSSKVAVTSVAKDSRGRGTLVTIQAKTSGEARIRVRQNGHESGFNVVVGYIKGIDVSTHNKDIDWKQVKAAGYQFAMIRGGFGKEDIVNQTDKYFEQNYAGATAAGMKVGLYHYSYATTVEEAKQEAQLCLQIINGRKLDYPIAFDIEDPRQKALPKQTVTDMIKAFCSEIEKAGYKPMICSYKSFLETKIDLTQVSQYDVWMAQYDIAQPTYKGTYQMWQYTSKGTVAGINGRVDLNYCYKAY